MLVYVVSVAYVTQLQGGPNSGMPLQNLDLAGCKKLHISEDNMDGLTSLLTLMIESIPNMASITAGLQFVTALKKFVIKNCQEVEPLKDLEKYDLSIFLPCDFPRLTRKTATIGFLRWKQEHVRRHLCICCPPGPSSDLNDQYHSSETAAFGDVTVGSSSLQRSQTSHLDLTQVNHVGGPSDSWPQDGSSSTSLEVVKRSAGEVPSVDSEVLALWNGLKLLSTLPSSPVWIVGESELVVKWTLEGYPYVLRDTYGGSGGGGNDGGGSGGGDEDDSSGGGGFNSLVVVVIAGGD
ncbi:hypothetical protein IFM89_025657 [Coptis chinensis]|uniref:Uncharacterized protein n=1 Tax=Coptis chinensis TaxID=261450 RepID=A0A835H5Z0_9MAGN|nr:hypothetical protein IFM89_025657 [Coptis chinensis]